MSSSTVSINERAFNEAILLGLVEVGNYLVDEMALIVPSDVNRIEMNKPIDRKDGKRPYRSSHFKPRQIFNHWYAGVTGNLKESLSFEVHPGKKMVEVGTLADGPAENYGKYLEYGTARMQARPFIRPTIADPKVQEKASVVFEAAFYKVLERFNR